MIGRRLSLLILAAGALAVYVIWDDRVGFFERFLLGEKASPTAISTVPAPVSAGGGKTQLNPVAGLSATALAEMIERPLFNPTRRPAPEEPPPPPPPPPAAEPEQPVVEHTVNPEDFTLLAVASNAGGKTALVRWNSANQVVRVKQGGALSDLQVIEVNDREVTLGRDGQSFKLKMFETPATPADPATDPNTEIVPQIEPDQSMQKPPPNVNPQ
jgi:hypothetical protein